MGLDVHLYRFEGADTEAILKLWRFSEEPWACKKESVADYYKKLRVKARELGLPEKIIKDSVFGGTQVSFPSVKHPEWPVGDWYSFSTIREMMEYFNGDDFYFVFPEARGIHGLFKPDWTKSRERLADFLEGLRKLSPRQIEDFHEQFMRPHVPPPHLFPGVKWATAMEIFEDHLAQIEVMIETLDFVRNSGNPREFLLYWSD